MDLVEEMAFAALQELNRGNYRFTMDDIAHSLGISKKTIYIHISGKEELLKRTVEYYFYMVKSCEREILDNENLDTLERLKKVLIVLPEKQMRVDFSRMRDLIERYPDVYKDVERHLSTEWEPTLTLYRQAIKEGRLKDIPEVIFKNMVQGAMKEFLSSGDLEKGQVTYEEALEQMIQVLFRGLEKA